MSNIMQAMTNVIQKEWSRKSPLEWSAIFLLGGAVTFMCGHSAFGADFDWKGGQGSPELNGWSVAANWCGNAIPSGVEFVYLSLDPTECGTTTSTCIYDLTSPTFVTSLTLRGSSPTKMKMHVRDGELSVASLYLEDYSELDIDQDRDPGIEYQTYLSGSIWADIASAATFNAGNVFLNGSNTILNLSGGGLFESSDFTIDAGTANANRWIKILGKTINMAPSAHAALKIFSEEDLSSGDYRAKLWLADGATFHWECDGDLHIRGGPTSAKRAELDLDSDLTDFSTASDFYLNSSVTGYVDIDIASGKKMVMPKFTITGPCVLKVTGQGTLESITNTCTIGCGSCP